jgi:2-C-methyl-D-erythritol 4-phosphate cytidylyltransferase/2-C-methyl-D-erythritol 2,4-cyclodiphosphate synthase
MKNVAIIVAAGEARRFGADVPKQYIKSNGKGLLCWSIDAFLQSNLLDYVVVVINKKHESFYKDAVNGLKNLECVFGGATRQESVYLGLKALEKYNPENVLIHDAARPLLSTRLIKDVIKNLDTYEAVDVGVPFVDTMKFQYNGDIKILNKDEIYATQTPQGFKFTMILDLHKVAKLGHTDDISLCLEKKIKVKKISGDIDNIKITYPNDLKYFSFIMKENKVYRTGFGLDVHKLSEPLNEDVTIKICGVDVQCKQTIIAHSDGDVGLHAATESLLGAMAAENIGQLFPPNDDKYKDMDSSYFLSYANNMLLEKKGGIVNIDITIICEKPKVMPYNMKMRQNIAKILGVSVEQVSVKATTTEKMGFLGTRQGIAAQSVCTIIL